MSRGEREGHDAARSSRSELEPAMQGSVDQPVVFLLRAQGGEPGELGPDAPHR